jgi:hypothetical protein
VCGQPPVDLGALGVVEVRGGADDRRDRELVELSASEQLTDLVEARMQVAADPYLHAGAGRRDVQGAPELVHDGRLAVPQRDELLDPRQRHVGSWDRGQVGEVRARPGRWCTSGMSWRVLYAVLMVGVVVGVDVCFFRGSEYLLPRLLVNVGIVLVFGAVYLRFLRPQ